VFDSWSSYSVDALVFTAVIAQVLRHATASNFQSNTSFEIVTTKVPEIRQIVHAILHLRFVPAVTGPGLIQSACVATELVFSGAISFLSLNHRQNVAVHRSGINIR